VTVPAAVPIAALAVSFLSLAISSTLAWLNPRQSRLAHSAKAPRLVADIGLSMRTVRRFSPLRGEHRFDEAAMSGHSGALGVRVRNDGERAVQVTSVICFAARPGMHPPTKAGVWPSGPELPHEVSTNEAIWDMPLEQVSRLLGFGRSRAEACDASFELSLSTGEVGNVGPVRLHFPPEDQRH
jgi:hypothetical protein